MGGVLCNLSVHAGHDPLRVNNNNKEKKSVSSEHEKTTIVRLRC